MISFHQSASYLKQSCPLLPCVFCISCFFFRPPQSLKTASFSLPQVWRGWGHPCSQGGRTSRTRPAVSAVSPNATLLPKASHSPSQAATCGSLAQGPDTRSRAFYALLREPAIFFTAAQILRVSWLKSLTQNVTQNTESRRGEERNDLRVFGDFRLKKARKALGRSGLTIGTQLITQRSEVQVLLPQP